MESEDRETYRRILQAEDAHVQRLRRSCRSDVFRNGSAGEFLKKFLITAKTRRRVLKPAIFLLALLPLLVLSWDLATGNVSPNPISDITNATGIWTLRFVMITLSVTPIRRITSWTIVGQFRRMMGLFAFFYASLHFTTYIWLDQFFQWGDMLKDVAKRPFITVGFTSFVLLIPLALTSTNGMIRRLGGKRWRALHRLVYGIGVGGVIHYLWLVKADTQRPMLYGLLLICLLSYRLWDYLRLRPGVAQFFSSIRSRSGIIRSQAE